MLLQKDVQKACLGRAKLNELHAKLRPWDFEH